jgi:hypothetical protein
MKEGVSRAGAGDPTSGLPWNGCRIITLCGGRERESRLRSHAAAAISGARDLTIAAAFSGKAAEHIIEVGRMRGRAGGHTALHLT